MEKGGFATWEDFKKLTEKDFPKLGLKKAEMKVFVSFVMRPTLKQTSLMAFFGK